MKFKKYDIVVCIADKNEWGSAINDFDENLRLALGQTKLPIKQGLYVVNEPKKLIYEGSVYITLFGFGDRPLRENAFAKITKLHSIEQMKNALKLIKDEK